MENRITSKDVWIIYKCFCGKRSTRNIDRELRPTEIGLLGMYEE